MARKRIVFLCGGGDSSRIILAALETLGADITTVLEQRPSPWLAFRKRVKRLGPKVALGQLMFRLLAVPCLRVATRRRIREIRDRLPIPTPAQFAANYRVSSANGEDTRNLLADIDPDLVVLNGTRILSGETLDTISAPIVNMHAGIAPAYRGVHGGYWALVDGRPDLFGTTVHRVDRGVDTGEVLGRAFASPTPRDTFVSYPYLQLQAGLPVLLRVVRDALDRREGEPVPDLGLDSHQRFHPTLGRYIRTRWRQGVK